MTYANTGQRAALTGGLRALADYRESNPEVPAATYSDVFTFPPDGDWAAMRVEIDHIAALLGVTSHNTSGGQYVATRSFGPIEYRAVAIPRTNDRDNRQSE
jgi:hypothetical protein